MAISRAAPKHEAPQKKGLIQKYCFNCHNAIGWAGGGALDTVPADDVPTDAKAAIRKRRGTEFMRPSGCAGWDDGPPGCEEIVWRHVGNF